MPWLLSLPTKDQLFLDIQEEGYQISVLNISFVHSKQLSMLRVNILNEANINISSPLFTRISQLEVFQGVNLILPI